MHSQRKIKRSIISLLSAVILFTALLPAAAPLRAAGAGGESVTAAFSAESFSEERIRLAVSALCERYGAENAAGLLNAGYGSVPCIDWIALSLYRYGLPADMFETYLRGAAASVAAPPAGADRARTAIAVALTGGTDSLILEALGGCVEAGAAISPLISSIHLMNNGYRSDARSNDESISLLLSLRLADGGWAVAGEYSDADITAMVLSALAFHKNEEGVESAVAGALAKLSSMQYDDGGMASMGAENPESASQTVIALSALGIDAMTAPEFIKNGKTLFDSIESFAVAGGGYSHAPGGGFDATATSQALMAYTAYLCFLRGRGPLFVSDGADPAHAEPPRKADATSSGTARETGGNADGEGKNAHSAAKAIALCAVFAAGGIACAMLFVFKKRNFKNFIAVGAAVLTVAAAVLFIRFESVDDHYKKTVKTDPAGTVVLTVDASGAGGELPDGYPADGMLLSGERFEIGEGDTVLDILNDASAAYGFQLDRSGTGGGAYIRGIAYLYEFDRGQLSGWTYYVNGKRAGVGCGEYVLHDGDEILWRYVIAFEADAS